MGFTQSLAHAKHAALALSYTPLDHRCLQRPPRLHSAHCSLWMQLVAWPFSPLPRDSLCFPDSVTTLGCVHFSADGMVLSLDLWVIDF